MAKKSLNINNSENIVDIQEMPILDLEEFDNEPLFIEEEAFNQTGNNDLITISKDELASLIEEKVKRALETQEVRKEITTGDQITFEKQFKKYLEYTKESDAQNLLDKHKRINNAPRIMMSIPVDIVNHRGRFGPGNYCHIRNKKDRQTGFPCTDRNGKIIREIYIPISIDQFHYPVVLAEYTEGSRFYPLAQASVPWPIATIVSELTMQIIVNPETGEKHIPEAVKNQMYLQQLQAMAA